LSLTDKMVLIGPQLKGQTDKMNHLMEVVENYDMKIEELKKEIVRLDYNKVGLE
jgi:hypothetical protein